MKRLLLLLPALALLFAGCLSDSGLGHGDIAEAEIVSSGATLGEVIEDPEESLLSLGVPVDEGFNCVEFKLQSAGETLIEAEGGRRFDPVIAVLDDDGAIIAVNDDWDGETGSRIALEEVPEGSRLVVWGVDGATGSVSITVSEASSDDADEWLAATSLSLGVMGSELLEDKGSESMKELIEDLDSEEIYASEYENALLVPFIVEEEARYSISLQSEDFDAYLILISFERRGLEFLEVNDDRGGSTDSKVIRVLEPGSYGAIVMSYFGEGGEFTLLLEEVEAGDGSIIPVEAPGEATGFLSGDQEAVLFWETIDEDWHYSSINGSTPVVAFTFSITQDADYYISASADFDATMTLIELSEYGGPIFVDYSDDDYGTDPGLTMSLLPCEMVALISSYSEGTTGEVTFSIELLEVFNPEPIALPPDTPVNLHLSPQQNHGLFDLEIIGGYVYGLSATSDHLDPVITLTFPDNSQLYDDDGGDNYDSYLEFVPQAEQLGQAVLRVDSYSEGVEGTITVTLTRLERLSEQESFSLYD